MVSLPAPGSVTAIVPCYDPRPDHFREALESLRRQTHRLFDVIVVDDGSTDRRFLGVLAELFPAARVVTHAANRGLPAARNSGVAAAATELFLQLDADDRIAPTFLEKALWALVSHPEWSFCNAWVRGFGAREYVWRHGFDEGREFLRENRVNPISVVRREADRAVGGHDEALRHGMEDWDYWLRMARSGRWGGTIPEPLVEYRLHDTPTFWEDRDDPVRRARFRRALRARHGELWRRRGWVQLASSPAGGDPPDALPPFVAPALREGRGTTVRSVLVVTGSLGAGGAERFVLDAVTRLVAGGAKVSLCATEPGTHEWKGLAEEATDDVFVLDRFLEPGDWPRFLVGLALSRGVDAVLLSASLAGYGLLPYLRARLPGVSFVDYVHMVDPSWRDGGFARASARAGRHLDATLSSSHAVAGWIAAERTDGPEPRVCPTGIDTRAWDPALFDRATARAALPAPPAPGTPVLLFAARLAPQKRPQLLVSILGELAARGTVFHAVVAGDGPQGAWLRRAVSRGRLAGRVTLLGAVAPGDMARLYAAADLFLLPSAFEGVALTLFEAMAMGVPPVAADVGGQRELVVPGTGLLVAPGPGELSRWVEAVSSLLSDEGERQRAGLAARERVKSLFDSDWSVRVLREVLSTPPVLRDEACGIGRAEEAGGVGDGRAGRPSEGEARAAAREVVEAVRASELAALAVTGSARTPKGLSSFLRRRIARPLYEWGLEAGFESLVTLKNFLRARPGARRGRPEER